MDILIKTDRRPVSGIRSMLFLIAATSLFAPENKDESEKGGGVW